MAIISGSIPSQVIQYTDAQAVAAVEAGSLSVAGALTIVGGAVIFPATQIPSANKNTLDDYEEGTWTPVMRGSTGSAGAWAAGSTGGNYTKVGRVVHCQMSQWLSNKGSYSGTFEVHGLPFVSGWLLSSGGIGYYPSNAVDGHMRGLQVPSSNSILQFGSGLRLDVPPNYTEVLTSFYLSCQFSYFIN